MLLLSMKRVTVSSPFSLVTDRWVQNASRLSSRNDDTVALVHAARLVWMARRVSVWQTEWSATMSDKIEIEHSDSGAELTKRNDSLLLLLLD